MKLVNNVMSMCNVAVAAEAMVLGVKAGMDPLRLRGQRWWIRYSYLGRRREESAGTSDQKKAERLLRQRIQECGRGRRIDPTAEHRVTMAALLDALVTDYTINKRRSTKDLGYRLAPLREAFGDRRALDVTAARVSEYVSDLLAAGMANASVNRELAPLKRAFRLGVEQERLASAPTVKVLREAAPRQGFLKVGDFEALVRYLPEHLQDYARFCYSTGTRKAKAAALAWSDIDREAGRITFRREHAKTGEPRVIPLVGELHAIIERRWAARTLGVRISPLVFHRAGQPIRTFRKAWQRACVAAGHAGLLFHDLRRSAVRNLVGAGVDQAVAMRISGHKTASVFQRYRIVDDADVRAALERTEAAGKRAAASNVVVLNRAAR